MREQNETLLQQQAPLAEQLRQLQQERDAATNRLASALAETARLRANPHELEVLKLRGEVGTLRADTTKRNATDNSLAQMASSPQMKDFMKTAMTSGIDKIYAKLIADLHLTPEQTAALKDLLVNKKTVGMDVGTEMLSGKLDAAGLKKLTDKINAEQSDADAQIKAFLGDQGFAVYQAYEKTYPDRAAISGPAGFEEQLTAGMELAPDQAEQLVAAMGDARQNFKFTVDYSAGANGKTDLASLYSEDNINRYQTEQQKLDDLYAARAQNILSPDQLAVFQKFLTNRLAMGAMSMQMSAKMFGPKTGGH